VKQVAEAMRKLGAKVTLQPVKVPHWVRGVETGELVEYAGRPAGISQRVVLTALGGSGATPAAGLTAPVIVVRSFDELKARAPKSKAASCCSTCPSTRAWPTAAWPARPTARPAGLPHRGPRMAAEMGAAAALVRSVGGADYRLPHTGATGLQDGARIPAAAVTVEDAMLMSAPGQARPGHDAPDPDAANPAGRRQLQRDRRLARHRQGRRDRDRVRPPRFLGPGHRRHDDASGVVSAMAVFDTLKKLDYRPRRTIRVIAWMNEENGTAAAHGYLDA
jgi:carboxypeptidase Q